MKAKNLSTGHMWAIIGLSGLLFLSAACQKNSSDVPNVAVDEYINLNLPEYLNLNAVNNWVYYDYAGNKGIIIIRSGPNEFTALERTCTFDPNAANSIVEGIQFDIFGIDSVCGSKFSLIDGNVSTGPANRPLIRYRTQLLPNNILRIYN
jgi:hypothetical protein